MDKQPQGDLPTCIKEALQAGKKAFDRKVKDIQRERIVPTEEVMPSQRSSRLSEEEFDGLVIEARQMICGEDGVSGTVAAVIRQSGSPESVVRNFIDAHSKNLNSSNLLVREYGGVGRAYMHAVINCLMSRRPDVKEEYNRRIAEHLARHDVKVPR